MRNSLPLSVRLDDAAEKSLAELAKNVNIKKATLAQILLEASIKALDPKSPLVMPVVFTVKGKK